MSKLKNKRLRLTFMQRLEAKLKESGIGEVESDEMGDDSCKYITLQKGLVKLEISFDMKGDKILDILVARDIYEKTDEEVLFTFDNNPI